MRCNSVLPFGCELCAVLHSLLHRGHIRKGCALHERRDIFILLERWDSLLDHHLPSFYAVLLDIDELREPSLFEWIGPVEG